MAWKFPEMLVSNLPRLLETSSSKIRNFLTHCYNYVFNFTVRRNLKSAEICKTGEIPNDRIATHRFSFVGASVANTVFNARNVRPVGPYCAGVGRASLSGPHHGARRKPSAGVSAG